MKRIYIPLWLALKQAKEMNPFLSQNDGICACYEIENMGFCKDGKTQWYHFIDTQGRPAYTLKF